MSLLLRYHQQIKTGSSKVLLEVCLLAGRSFDELIECFRHFKYPYISEVSPFVI